MRSSKTAAERTLLIAKIFIYSGLLAGASASYGSDLRALQREIREAGFVPIYPLTDGITAGMLYEEIKDAGGNKVQSVLCEDLFSSSRPRQRNVLLKTKLTSSTSNTSAELTFYEKLFKAPANAAASLNAAGVKSAVIKPLETKITSIGAKLSANGEKRVVSADCLAQVAGYFDIKGKTSSKLFLVQQVLTARGLEYELKAERKIDASLGGLLEEIFGLKFSYQRKGDLGVSLRFTAEEAFPLVALGYSPVPVKQLQRLKEVGSNVRATFASGQIDFEQPTSLTLQRR
jgi:hypothetical protein